MTLGALNDPELQGLYKTLEAALEWGRIQLEDTEVRFGLVRPLEKTLTALPEPPKFMVESPAAQIVKLLWFKTHPEKADVDFIVPQLSHNVPMVRTTAADTLMAVLKDHRQWTDPALSRRTRMALQQQRHNESSPIISYQIEELFEEFEKSSRSRQQSQHRIPPLNPYVAGPVVDRKDRLYGRENILREIRHVLGKGEGIRSIVLYGARRTGKTSLLYRFREGALGEAFVPVYVDMQGQSGTLSGFLENVAGNINRAISQSQHSSNGAPDLPLVPVNLAVFQRYVEKTLDCINPACLLILFDEYEVLRDYIRSADVARSLQSLLEQNKRLFFIFAGAQKVESLQEKNFMLLLDNCKYMQLTYLKPEETRRLITEPAKGRLEFPEKVIDEIQRLCAGHPFYTQLICHSLFDLLQGRGKVTSEHLEQVVQEFLENPAPHLVLGWNGLALDQKLVAATLTEVQGKENHWVSPANLVTHLRQVSYPIQPDSGEIQQTLGALREFDWVNKKEGERLYQISLGLVRRWIAEHRSIWEILNEHTRNVVERVVELGVRAKAFFIDILILLICNLVIASLFDDWIAQTTLPLFPVLVMAYFTLTILAFRGTPGMLMVRIRALSETGTRLRAPHAIQFGALLSLPLFLFTSSFFFFNFEHATNVAWALLIASAFLAFLHVAKIQVSKQRRGLFDQLAHALLVRQ